MSAELGHFALILALAIALVQATLPLWGAAKRDYGLIALGRQGAILQFLAIAFAFGCLTYAFVVSDFSVAVVAENSHTMKPMLYKVAGVWGNHEGSLLLWMLILSVFGAAVAVLGNNLPETLRARVLAVQGMIAVGFLSFTLFTSDPFLRLDPAPPNGNGLNPLLQDPGLAFHPPFLYLGYVGFSIAFAFAIAALIEGRVDTAWARWVRPWTLAAWMFLTIGITFGSYWSYYVLGWGGYWAWDPTENASFMPWIAGTALVHSAIVVEKRDALKVWTILLAILTFSFSLLGTFLVRSGAITSVHAFANDPARGVYILAFLVTVVGGSLILFAIRAPSLKPGGVFAPISREGALVLNNLLLAAAAATVFFGTLFPLFADVVGKKISVGPPYFNATFIPLMIPLVVALGVGPMLSWKRGDLPGALSRLKAVAGISLAAFFVAWYWSDNRSAMAGLGMGLGFWLVGSSAVQFFDRIRLFSAPLSESFRRARGLPRSAWGMTVAHAGVGVFILGLTVSGAWEQEKLTIMNPGDSVDVGAYHFTLAGVSDNVPGSNFTAMQGTLDVYRDGKLVTVLKPEVKHFTNPPMDTTQAAIHTMATGDLYVVIGNSQSGGYAVRLYVKPLVKLIWAGALIMALGGGLSLSDRRHRVGAPARKLAAAGKAAQPAE